MAERPYMVYAALSAVAISGVMPAQSLPSVSPPPSATTTQAIAPKAKAIADPATGALPTDPDQLIQLWSKGDDIEQTLVAIVVGSAEGTRTIDGGKTSLYDSHIDPGNGVQNRGSFSYQFGNAENLTPQESSRRQFNKIKGHMETVKQQIAQYGITLTPWEWMNAIDLANQAPLCITSKGGFVERLVQARKKASAEGWDEFKTVLYARVWSYWDPDKGRFDASGLRAYDDISKQESVNRDQHRRMNMMAQALERAQSRGVVGSFSVAGGDAYQPVSYNPAEMQAFAVWLRTQSIRGQHR